VTGTGAAVVVGAVVGGVLVGGVVVVGASVLGAAVVAGASVSGAGVPREVTSTASDASPSRVGATASVRDGLDAA
jgi:hypothetical protein